MVKMGQIEKINKIITEFVEQNDIIDDFTLNVSTDRTCSAMFFDDDFVLVMVVKLGNLMDVDTDRLMEYLKDVSGERLR